MSDDDMPEDRAQTCEPRILRLVERLIEERGGAHEGGSRFVLECVRAEFEAEERMMERHGYPDLPRHRSRHEAILGDVAAGDGDLQRLERLRASIQRHVECLDWEYSRYLARTTCRFPLPSA